MHRPEEKRRHELRRAGVCTSAPLQRRPLGQLLVAGVAPCCEGDQFLFGRPVDTPTVVTTADRIKRLLAQAPADHVLEPCSTPQIARCMREEGLEGVTAAAEIGEHP